MPRYARWVSEGMKARGHQVEIWSPKATFFNFNVPVGLKKWMGYIDQYIIFPIEVKNKLKKLPKDTLFVFTDHALGPWVPLVANRSHVIHCHDFLAQRSALGEFKENPTSWTGKIYQWYIRRGYQKGKNFISISKKTQADLHQFLKKKPVVSEIVYNGLTQVFTPTNDLTTTRKEIEKKIGIDVKEGYLLHVGGNQWYKNRVGVIEIYDTWRTQSIKQLPLLMLGSPPSKEIVQLYSSSIYKDDIHFITNASDELVKLAYQGAEVFLFPSLEEGFGWPIVESMASGCPVITTDAAPMSEVGGDVALRIARRPYQSKIDSWKQESAKALNELLQISQVEYGVIVKKGLKRAKEFSSESALDKIEIHYINISNKIENIH
ncbi:MAG: glycosyltransferase [Runella zeae]